MTSGIFSNKEGETFSNPKMQGNVGMGYAIAYFTRRGWIVSIPLTDSQDYDLLVEDPEDGKIYRIQVKTTRYQREGVYESNLVVGGGNRRGTAQKQKTLEQQNVDAVYILTDDGSQYLIPKDLIIGQKYIKLGIEYQKFKTSTKVI